MGYSGIQQELEQAVREETAQRRRFYRNLAYTITGLAGYPAAEIASGSGDLISSENFLPAVILGTGALFVLKGVHGIIKYGREWCRTSKKVKELEKDKEMYQKNPLYKYQRRRNITFMF